MEECLKRVPSRIVYGARVPERDLIAEPGADFHTRPMTGGEGYIDLETREWRKVLTRDLVEWTTLADGLDNVDYVASIYPDDMNLDTRDVHILRLLLQNSVKHVEVQPYTGVGVGYMVEMIKAVPGRFRRSEKETAAQRAHLRPWRPSSGCPILWTSVHRGAAAHPHRARTPCRLPAPPVP